MSNNLNLDQLAEDQALPAATVNTQFGQIDAAITEQIVTDVAGTNKTLTALVYRSAVKHQIAGVTTAGIQVTLPAIRKFSFFTSAAANTNDFVLKVGTTTKTVSPGQFVFVYTDGTTNGLQAYSLVDATGLTAADVSGLAEFVQDTMGTSLVAGSGIAIVYNDAAGTITISSSAAYSAVQAETASKTLVLADGDSKFITASSSSAIVLTIPPNSSVAFPIGTELAAVQTGTGAVSFAPGAGVTLSFPTGFLAAARAQFSVISAKKIATDTWVVFGDLGT